MVIQESSSGDDPGQPFQCAPQASRKRSFRTMAALPERLVAETVRSEGSSTRERHPVSEEQSQRGYRGNESLILVGFFGVGKRTLGLIASVALRRELIDFDVLFAQRAGLAPADFIASHGTQVYRELEYKITVDILEHKRTGCVLVGFFKLPRTKEYKLLQNISKTNPVIHVRRDRNILLNAWRDQDDKFNQAYNLSSTMYAKCTNFDFFNTTQPDQDGPKAPLKLKQTEQDFTRFLSSLFGRPSCLLRSVDALSSSYTHSLQVPLHWLEDPKSDLAELDSGADAVSLVVDAEAEDMDSLACRISKHMSSLRRHTRAPIIFDIAHTAVFQSQHYWSLLEVGLRQAPDMITIPLDLPEDVFGSLNAARGHTKVIGIAHTSNSWSNIWNRASNMMYEKARSLRCDAMRITSASNSRIEDLDCIHSVHEANRASPLPVIGYNTMGRTSICFNPVLSPVVVFSLSQTGVTLRQAQEALYSGFFLSSKRFTIVGKSVSYSLSPAMHNAAYKACGMPHVYDSMSIPFSSIQRLLKEEDRGGLAVSLPYKTHILPFLSEMSLDAHHIGAVNTVVLERASGRDSPARTALKGYNTDYMGIWNCLERNLSPANSVRPATSALIIGAGGMARAAVYACYKAGIHNICIYNRTAQNADSLARYYSSLSKTVLDAPLSLSVLESLGASWPTQISQPTVIISCIPADGTGSNIPAISSIPDQWLHSRTGGVFIELSYKPFVTRFMKQMSAKASQGWIVVDGLEVLVEQGVAQFEIFTGRPAPKHVMRDAVRKVYTRAHGDQTEENYSS
ncbi:Pentafunctional AROM polypeptide [Aspergillus sclerotialis]|uniref:Pentafunctional AROM polypeptide n=1 Tax=Aspergillus sclerotialis TaxID=2070753 RepID=A0A3A2ZDM9_9EURO|nr:Pentafunctional AROM polypeptide [Aspergillus sclerotialis]